MKKMSLTLVALSTLFAPFAVDAQGSAAPTSERPSDPTASQSYEAGRKVQSEAEIFDAKKEYKKAIYAYNEAIHFYRASQIIDPAWNPQRVQAQIDACKNRLTRLDRLDQESAMADEATSTPSPTANPATTPRHTPPVSRATGILKERPSGPPAVTPTQPQPTTSNLSSLSNIAAEVAKMEKETRDLRTLNTTLTNELEYWKNQAANAVPSEEQVAETSHLRSELQKAQRQYTEVKANLSYVQEGWDASRKELFEIEKKWNASQSECRLLKSAVEERAQTINRLMDQETKLIKEAKDNQEKFAKDKQSLTDNFNKTKSDLTSAHQQKIKEIETANTQKVTALNEQITKAQADFKSAQEKNEQAFKAELAKLQADFDAKTKTAQDDNAKVKADLESQIKTAKDEIVKLNAALEAKNQQSLNFEKTITDLNAKIIKGEEFLNIEKNKSIEFEKQIQTLTAQLNVLQNAEKEGAALQTKITALEQEKAALTAKIAHHDTEVTSLKQSLKEAIDASTQKQAELTKAKKDLEAQTVQLNTAQNTANSVQETLKANQAEIATLKGQIKELTSHDLSQQVQTLSDEKNRLTTQLTQMTQEFKDVKASCTQLQDENKKFIEVQTLLNTTNNELAKTKNELRQAQANLESLPSLQAKANELTQAKANLEHQVRTQDELKRKLNVAANEIESLNAEILKLKANPIIKDNPETVKALETLKKEQEAFAKSTQEKQVQLENQLKEAQAKAKDTPAPSATDEQLQQKNKTIDTLMQERADLAKRVTELQGEIEKLRGVQP